MLINKVLWAIANLIWIREIRRELQKRNLIGSGTIRVSFSGELIYQVADNNYEREAALMEELDDIKSLMSPRQEQIVLKRLDLNVCESTIDKEIGSIKKVLERKLVARATSNEQRATSNEVLTRLEKNDSLFLRFITLFFRFSLHC